MQDLNNQISKEKKEQIIRNYKFIFPCPHCEKEINDNHFSQNQRVFHYINENIRQIVENHFSFQEEYYHQKWWEKMEKERVYENFSEVKKLRENIGEQEKNLRWLQSSQYIEKLDRVRQLSEINEQQKKKIAELQSSEFIEKLERVRQLAEENNKLRGQIQLLQAHERTSKRKGENFEQYIWEELNRVFDNKDKISKITQMGKRADFLQEVLTESEPKKLAGRIIYEVKDTEKWDNGWVDKLENDMAQLKAEFGIIIATCENGKPLRCLDPRKKIYVSDDANFVYIAKIIRDSLIQKHNLLEVVNTDNKEKRIKNFEEWIESRLPQFLARLEKELTDLNKNANNIGRIAENIKSSEISIRKIILEEVRTELSSL
ncbi:MAG: hypothetical protein MRERC_1c064 [Mycoplasmataceae bacterium RC_NB112A]|nr:MAG: hypothetical protein MRERC_1c064 [Mycoplasmataceae bacterium RC_NB112A]